MRAPRRLFAVALTALLVSCTPPETDPNDGGGGPGPNNPGNSDGGDGGDPNNPDPNGPPDGPEDDPFGKPPGPDYTQNKRIDTDCDGLSDAEEWGNIYAGDKRTDPDMWDTDRDGLRDGLEAGRNSTLNEDPQCAALFHKDLDPSSRTNPTNPDTDGDGILDGIEDRNHNGRLDPGESDPSNPDSDGDGLTDSEEDTNKNGRVDPGETNPRMRDTDGDGLSDFIERKSSGTDPLNADMDGDTCPDGAEDRNGNGIVDPGETNPKNSADCGGSTTGQDTDGDGIPDDVEEANGTDWRNADTDGDGLRDGQEDRNRNGRVDPGETDPRSIDSDCDGLVDGPSFNGFLGEDLNRSGGRDPGETDPTKRDTDGDGLLDGVERGVSTEAAPIKTCNYVGDQDPSSRTDPTNTDSDGDGIADGAEDANQNGRVDPGELDPNNGADGSGSTPAGQACSAGNLRQVVFKEDNGADIRLALRPTFTDVKQFSVANGKGFIGYDPTNKVTFLAYKRAQAGTSTSVAGDESFVRGQLGSNVAADTTQTFTTWDNQPALQAVYSVANTSSLGAYTNSTATTLVGAGAGILSGGTDVSGPFKIQAQYVHRSNNSVLVVLAIAPAAAFAAEPGLFVVGDTAGGTALAQFGDADAVQCEAFNSQGSGPTDFVFVVDNSGSMETSQTVLGEAANAVAARLGNSQLDWRIALVTSSYYDESYTSDKNLFRGFTRDINQFKAWLQKGAACPNPSEGCWIGTSGDVDEYFLTPARRAVEYMTNAGTPVAKKYRPGARVVIIMLTDTRDPSTDNKSDNSSKNTLAAFVTYFKGANPTNQPIQMHGIICDPEDGAKCHYQEDHLNPIHKDAIQALGGIVGSIRTAAGIQTAINSIMDSVIGSGGYKTIKPAIGASVRVALAAVRDASCNRNDVPRSRQNGFDVDGRSGALSFYGTCRPPETGATQGAISYRYWTDLTTGSDGNVAPCSTDTKYYDSRDPDFCKGTLVCNRTSNVCECPADCGGGGAPGQVCNTNRDVCSWSCGADCAGACGSFETCNPTTCACQCAQSATCSPGFKFDPASCGCVCDTGALNCGSNYQADAAACACICRDNCGGSCGAGTKCNTSTCVCDAVLN